MAERETGKVEVSFSMQNMVDVSTLWAFIAPVEMYSAVAKRAGYSGIEYFPFRVPHIQVRTGLITNGALKSITSAHQSFRTEKTLKEVRNHPNPKLAAQAYVTMPEKFASLKDLEKLQKELGHKLPVVVYPPNEWMSETRPAIFNKLANKLIQPAPELIEALGQNMEKADKFGYKLCLDLFHIRRNVTQIFESQFGRWQDVLPVLLPKTKEIRLDVGRNDLNGPFDSMQELKDIYSNERKTDIVPMLEAIRDFGWTGPIVTEIPATSAKNLISNAKLATPSMIVRVHSQIVENIKNIWK